MKKHSGRSRLHCPVCGAGRPLLYRLYGRAHPERIPHVPVRAGRLLSHGDLCGPATTFRTLLQDAKFIRSMQNTILLIVVVTIMTFAFALVFAGILTREKIRGQNFFRVIFYIPNILSVVVISGIFSAIYKPENGMLNSTAVLFCRVRRYMVLWKDAEPGNGQHHHRHGLAGHRLLHGHVYGLHGQRCLAASMRAPAWTVPAA